MIHFTISMLFAVGIGPLFIVFNIPGEKEMMTAADYLILFQMGAMGYMIRSGIVMVKEIRGK